MWQQTATYISLHNYLLSPSKQLKAEQQNYVSYWHMIVSSQDNCPRSTLVLNCDGSLF
jgi:hypothetical protein